MSGSGKSVEVLGRDVAREAYRVRARVRQRDVMAFVPECLMEGMRPGERPSHQEAYEWIAAHGKALVTAVTALTEGRRPKPPYDLLALDPETTDAR